MYGPTLSFWFSNYLSCRFYWEIITELFLPLLDILVTISTSRVECKSDNPLSILVHSSNNYSAGLSSSSVDSIAKIPNLQSAKVLVRICVWYNINIELNIFFCVSEFMKHSTLLGLLFEILLYCPMTIPDGAYHLVSATKAFQCKHHFEGLVYLYLDSFQDYTTFRIFDLWTNEENEKMLFLDVKLRKVNIFYGYDLKKGFRMGIKHDVSTLRVMTL